VVDDINTASSYRRRFQRLLDRETVDDVIQRLSDRIEKFREEG